MKKQNQNQYELLLNNDKSWNVLDSTRVEKEFVFKNLKKALVFVDSVGKIAERKNLNPEIILQGWGKVKIIMRSSSHIFSLQNKMQKMGGR